MRQPDRPGLVVAGRAALIVVLAVALGSVHVARPATVCLLRATTGVPCPFCGGTTAMVRLGRADLLGALRASPLAVLGAPVVAALPLLRRHLARLPAHTRLGLLVVTLGGAEVWQLVRAGLL